MNLSPTVARIAYAILAGVVAFLIVYIIGSFLNGDAGAKLQQYAALVGVLVAIVYFFGRPAPRV